MDKKTIAEAYKKAFEKYRCFAADAIDAKRLEIQSGDEEISAHFGKLSESNTAKARRRARQMTTFAQRLKVASVEELK